MGFPNPIVECAFNNGSDETLYATQGWAEVTQWVKSMSGPLRGRQYEVDRSEAGTLTVVLDNTDGEFTPGNPTSPFYPNIKANRRFRVRGKNMVAPNIGTGGGKDHSTVHFEKPTWSGGTYTTGVGDPVWKQHDPATYPALPAELTDHIEVTVEAGTYSGFRRLLSWVVPLELGVRLTHSAYIWKISGTEPAGEGRFEVFYFDNEDVDIIGTTSGLYGLNRPMERYFPNTPTTPTRKQFSHAPVGTAKYARVVWAVYYGEGTTVSAPITYGITGIQTELPANLAPNPNGDWDQLHWHGRGTEDTTVLSATDGVRGWTSFTWTDAAASLYQTIPHLIPGETYAVTAEVNLSDAHPAVVLTGDGGQTGQQEFRFPDVYDDFSDRTLGSGWGNSSGSFLGGGGIAWTASGTGTTDVTGGVGRMSMTTVNAPLFQQAGISAAENWDLTFDFMVPVLPTGASVEIGPNIAFPNGVGATQNDYGIQFNVQPGGTVTLQWRKYVNGVGTWTTVGTATQTVTAGTWYRVRMQRMGNRLRGSLRLPGALPNWELVVNDSAHQGVTGSPFIRSKLTTGNTNTLPYVVQFDVIRFTKLNWVTLRTYFQAGGPEEDVEFVIAPDQGSPTGLEMFVRGLNVQRVLDPLTETLAPEVAVPAAATTYERPKDIFEGWVERWPWRVDEDETTVVVVDRLKRVGVIELSNVVLETLQQDAPQLILPFNDDPTNNVGVVTWYGTWAQESGVVGQAITPSKGDILTSTYTLGVEGPTDEPAIDWLPASNTVGYYVLVPFSPDFANPPPPTTTPPPSAPPSTTTKQYTKTYYATWSRSYDSDGTTRWDDTPYLYHGCYFCSNNQRALVGFNWSAIKADLAGASIVSVHFTMKNAHARWNKGLYAHIGTHTYSSKPGSWSSGSVSENRWKVFFKETEKKSVALPASVGNDFKAGTTKGIAVGPAPSNITDNYGYFYGATHSAKPYLTITYKK